MPFYTLTLMTAGPHTAILVSTWTLFAPGLKIARALCGAVLVRVVAFG
jgi:hypothetical protein